MYEQLTPHKCFNPNYIYTYNICMCLMIAESESDKKQWRKDCLESPYIIQMIYTWLHITLHITLQVHYQ